MSILDNERNFILIKREQRLKFVGLYIVHSFFVQAHFQTGDLSN